MSLRNDNNNTQEEEDKGAAKAQEYVHEAFKGLGVALAGLALSVLMSSLQGGSKTF